MKYDITKSSSPKMPELGRGTECLKLLLSQTSKDMNEPLVPIFFPILGAHISGTEFPENLAVVASVNYKTEDITFSVLDLTFNKILWNCNINETNVGLEYLRITMQGAGSDCIDVSTNQYDYCISLSEEICKKKN